MSSLRWSADCWRLLVAVSAAGVVILTGQCVNNAGSVVVAASTLADCCILLLPSALVSVTATRKSASRSVAADATVDALLVLRVALHRFAATVVIGKTMPAPRSL
jgi:hypothetical protein